MHPENLFQIFSQVFIESQQSFNKVESDLRSRCRVIAQKLNNVVEDIENDAFQANLNNIFDLEEDFNLVIKSAKELKNRRTLIKDSVEQLKKSTEKHVSRNL